MGRFSFSTLSHKLPKAFAAMALLAAGITAQPANTILLERWDGVTGTLVTDLTSNANYPNNPTSRSYPTLYELPTNTADNYGTRTRGYITPPTTGSYTFWIASDDNSELWLGTSSDPATARLVASVPSWTNSREWTKFTQQQSVAISLTAGTRYYIETRHKEGTGGDNLAVGWQGPGITGEAERPIPGTRLSPYVLTTPVAMTLLQERWDGITGTTVASLTSNANYPNNPTSRSYPTVYEMTQNTADNYGARTRGYITPPTTGNYTFWIASDDNSELWLGTSSDPATARIIATVGDYTNSREWTKFASQQSAAIALTAGTRYYIESRVKEGTGNDNLAVGWQGPGITADAERPIPGTRLAPFILNATPSITTQPLPQTVNVGQVATFSVTATGSTPLSYQWRRGGTDIAGATSSTYTTPATAPTDNGQQFTVLVSNAAGSVLSNQALLTVNIPPTIASQPVPQTVNVGQTASFTVVASGTTPFTYQWLRNNAPIGGATAATYVTPPTVSGDNGTQFSVVVTNVAGTVTSANALLTVNGAPTIVTQPVSQTVNVGQTATFSVVASSTGPLTYQWTKNTVNIPGANASSYTTPPATAADNLTAYAVIVGNAVGSVTSATANLNVNTPPVIVTQPASQTVNPGQFASFFVTATGTTPFTYQWRKNGTDIVGATASSYSTPAVTAADNGSQFSVVVSNVVGPVTSTNALLTVITPPVITVPPANQTVTLGQTATFSVTATGLGTLTYQWRKNGVNIPAATAVSYTTPATVSTDNGAQFSVVVSNSAGPTTSGNAILTVIIVATNSRKLAVSGELMDASGNPLGYPTPVTVDAIVNLYNDSIAGTSMYTETFRASVFKGIRVSNGLFVARLGEGTTTQNLQQVITANANLWVEVTIDDGTPDILRPRTPLTAGAYSLGGTPAAALAPALTGSGDPNSLAIDGEVGATYVNSADNSTWFKLKSAWKRLD